jgi:hypothetical protein
MARQAPSSLGWAGLRNFRRSTAQALAQTLATTVTTLPAWRPEKPASY